MKTLYIPFEDIDYKKLKKAKGDLTWHDFMLKKASSETILKADSEPAAIKQNG